MEKRRGKSENDMQKKLQSMILCLKASNLLLSLSSKPPVNPHNNEEMEGILKRVDHLEREVVRERCINLSLKLCKIWEVVVLALGLLALLILAWIFSV
ncbi:hypothetical protein AMTR_s00038p00181020 [Amborella trichopoda]|uniref:Uncharacterized protein n=1 Tax=Amborella trichopoda TaxID=13333 RepID=U5CZS2_AMBTC|nr:hypothetical protein AMTR_s00038p00181020 [Amborella trichopoda]